MQKSVLADLFARKFKTRPESVEALPLSGSSRRYYRLSAGDFSAVGTYGPDAKENKAYISFTRHFSSKNLPVPELYLVSSDGMAYLQQDLGDVTLRNHLEKLNPNGTYHPGARPLYEDALTQLIRFQVDGHKSLDYSLCVPRDRFDRQSMLWDLNHFKYFFVKIAGIPFDEQALEDDFQKLATQLDAVPRNYFMFRDFQSRNIMVYRNQCYFIDYQGGRMGALQYDPASLLFEAICQVPPSDRALLLDFYVHKLATKVPLDIPAFHAHFHSFALIRLLQSLGAYGLRGWIEKKPLFLQSISRALNNLEWMLSQDYVFDGLDTLRRLAENICRNTAIRSEIPKEADKLTVRIGSFSYRKSIPDDHTGNGGGFVFDCRGIHNPGRYPEYRDLNGKDREIDEFFNRNNEMRDFLTNVYRLVDNSVKSYISSDFRHLMVSFGCTGGKHRSVYAAEKLAEHLKQNDAVIVELKHYEMESWGT
jgi:aminoglycoside/choline kinase family phosphotransferase